MSNAPPCKGCPNRHPVCHDGCEAYRDYKARRKAALEYTSRMNASGSVYREDAEDRHRRRDKRRPLPFAVK